MNLYSKTQNMKLASQHAVRRGGGSMQRSAFRRRGATIVEMAIVGGVFLMLLIGIVEMGRVAWAREVITAAARNFRRHDCNSRHH